MEQDQSKVTEQVAPSFAFGSTQEIYLVDDEFKALQVGEVILKSNGYSVRSFQDPGEAYDAYHGASKKPGLLISDYSMPQMNGVELMVKCRQICPDLKVIILSGTLENEALHRYPFKVNAFFEKPIHSQNFLKVVAGLLAPSSNTPSN
ncbi:MAG: response regulator receiver protein [Verrucomicrobiales bacterium]|nr:response regulator receiver protein [Verrucomicrobiales bacterium]